HIYAGERHGIPDRTPDGELCPSLHHRFSRGSCDRPWKHSADCLSPRFPLGRIDCRQPVTLPVPLVRSISRVRDFQKSHRLLTTTASESWVGRRLRATLHPNTIL